MKVLAAKTIIKIKTIIEIEIQRQLSFRIDILFYRFSNVVDILAQIIIWTFVFQNNEIVSGYTYNEMLTYIIIGWLMVYITSNYGLENNISRDIHEGNLSNFLVKPIDYIKYIIIFTIGRNVIALTFGLATAGVLIFFMFDKIIIENNLLKLIIIAGMLVGGFFINLMISMLIGMAAFWTESVSGIRYSTRVLVSFLSGRLFPLNMLPIFYFKLTLFFPFVYVYFIPLQLYLGKISIRQSMVYLVVEILWLVLLYSSVRLLYKKGLKKYEGVGI